MSNNYFMPKNVFKGRDSSGNSYRFEEWDFSTLATMEVPGFFIALICAFAIGSVIAPVLAVIILLYQGVNARLAYAITGIISGYVLYDFYNGWLCMIATSFFANEKWMYYIMSANISTLLVSIVFVVFGGYLRNYVFKTVSIYTEDDYNKLPNSTKNMLAKEVDNATTRIFYLVCALIFIGFLIGTVIDKDHKGWVNKNVEHVE